MRATAMSGARRLALFILLLTLIAALGLELTLRATPFDTARLDGFSESRRLLDARGRLLREAVNASGARARWTELDDISPLVAGAVVAVEDARFSRHAGVDPAGVARAVLDSAARGRVVSGASTLTMQLSRLLFRHPRSARGKLAQALGALRIERAVSKRVILEQYLNRAPFGAGTVGVEAASRRYFGKPSRHLSLAEAALLAGLPQAPTALNPLRHEPAARQRQRHVLERMLEVGAIDAEAYERACRQPLRLTPEPAPPAALHFTDYVLAHRPPAGDVHTTLDSGLEKRLERMVAEHVRAFASGGLTNAAVVVLDNERCEILAMVGSTGYWQGASGAVNGALARRQPGSALKPFTYALGFERLYTPATVVADVETRYPGAGGTLYRPRNYSEELSGPILMAEALGRSLNVPAVRVANGVGTRELLGRLRAAGFASLDQPAEHYGLGLTLGNGEVTLLELAQGFAVFARGGMSCTAHGWRGAPLATSRRVFSPQVSHLVTDVLGDEELRIRAFGAGNPLLLGFPMAVKTGTSSNWRDSWAIGYTERHTLAVWAGDFAGRPMHQLSGAAGAGPLFHNAARLLADRRGFPRLPAAPEGVETIRVCALSGLAAGEHCPHRRAVTVLSDPVSDAVSDTVSDDGDNPANTSGAACTWHRALAVDRRNGLLASDRCPSRFVHRRVFEVLPPRYAEWQATHGSLRPPTRYSPLCPETGLTADALVITHPRDGDVFLVEPGYDRDTQSLELRAEIDPALPEATWLLDGEALARAEWPYSATWKLARGRHRLKLAGGGRRSDPVEFEVR